MRIIRSRDFSPARAWDAIDIANMSGITTGLHPRGEARILVVERQGSV